MASAFNDFRLDESLLDTSGYPNKWLKGPESLNQFADRYVYSQRSLSFEADALNAFSGLLNRQNFLHISGQPVIVPGSNLPACAGFAMGLLWSTKSKRLTSRLPRSKAVKSGKSLERNVTRRPGFPSWSWPSVNATIVPPPSPPDYGNLYQKFVRETSHFEDYPLPSTHFYVPDKDGGPCVDLCCVAQTLYETMKTKNVNVDKLVVEGDIVKIMFPGHRKDNHFSGRHEDRDYQGSSAQYLLEYQETECQHYLFVALDLNPLDDTMGLYDVGRLKQMCLSEESEDALVLIDWRTDCKMDYSRWVLMLLRWLDDETAERVGIIYGYDSMQLTSSTEQIPRQRKRFTLV